jgi:hypothetical protein
VNLVLDHRIVGRDRRLNLTDCFGDRRFQLLQPSRRSLTNLPPAGLDSS